MGDTQLLRSPSSPPALELWGGIECTVNRVNNCYFDQIKRSGHWRRLDDLKRVVELGVRAIRYPVLWEHHSGIQVNWTWAEERLEFLRESNVQPIVGLVHHGSGPWHTSLIKPNFVDGLEQHASAVAARFPWLKYFTPVNEPLTTARFSCLYGHWYPHHRSPESFVKALVIQCAATRKAMRAIRKINPEAQLVQTEDMGKVYSTELLGYQAEFENNRRWLSFDLLCGKVDSTHPLWDYLLKCGMDEQTLMSFVEDPCPPDIMGINHYVTSERFLDECLERYPERAYGGNGRHRYADVSAVRVSAPGIAGPYGILKETWERFRRPIAVTEAHLGCTRDEQVRWLVEFWKSAQALRNEGADIRAITVWSMLGAYDWNSLLTQSQDYYESGAFDLRGPEPRKTALAQCAEALAKTGKYEHPVIDSQGWWRRSVRILYPAVVPAASTSAPLISWDRFPEIIRTKSLEPRPLLITGATGTLGQAFRKLCETRGLSCYLTTREEMDVADPDSVAKMVDRVKPWAVVNTAGYVRVDQAEAEVDLCFRENLEGPSVLAAACARRQLGFVTFSSDLVFDGRKGAPYVESDALCPLNVYGKSKAQAENIVLSLHPKSLVVRTSAFFGPWDHYNFAFSILRRLKGGEIISVPDDAIISPTYVPDLVNATLDLLIDQEIGLWHLANAGALSWYDFAKRLAQESDLPTDRLEARPLHKFHQPAERPLYSVLGSERGQILPSFEDALDRFFEDLALHEKDSPLNSEFQNAPQSGNSMDSSAIPCVEGKEAASI